MPTPPALVPGALLASRYRLVRPVGTGGGGQTWLAEVAGEDRQVAVKVISSDEERAQEELLREASLLSRVRHPGLVAYEGCFDLPEQGLSCLVTGWVAGGDLERWWSSRPGPLALDRVLDGVRQVAEALSAVHGAGVLHRDLKPQNVLVHEAAEGLRLVLTDLGLARRLVADRVHVTGRLGTYGYAAPEQWSGAPLGPETDVYALGGLAWFLLAGEPPAPLPGKGGRPPALRLDPRLAPDPRVPALRGLVAWMMRPEPAHRPSLDQVCRCLARLAEGRTRLPFGAARRRHQLPWLALGVTGALVLGIAAWPTDPEGVPAPERPEPAAPEAAAAELVAPAQLAPEPELEPEPLPEPAAAAEPAPVAQPPPEPPPGRIGTLRLGLAEPLPLGVHLLAVTPDGREHRAQGEHLALTQVPAGELAISLRGPAGPIASGQLRLEAAELARVLCRSRSTELHCEVL